MPFLSTPSVGRATAAAALSAAWLAISIHALRGEGDVDKQLFANQILRFLSTPSVGRATLEQPELLLDFKISIHALRGEGDENPLFAKSQF